MSYDIHRILFYIFGGMGIAFVVVAVILFFRLEIYRIVGDLNGKNARKAIRGIYEQNLSGNGVRLSGKVSRRSLDQNGTVITEKIATQEIPSMVPVAEETIVLNEGFSILEDITYIHANTII